MYDIILCILFEQFVGCLTKSVSIIFTVVRPTRDNLNTLSINSLGLIILISFYHKK